MTTKKEENWKEILARMEAKTDFLMEEVDRINQTINPPTWKKLVRWIWRHWLMIALLLLVGFIALNAWEAFQELNARISAIAEIPSNAKDSLWDTVEKVKFW